MRLISLALNVPGPVAVARLVAEGASAHKVEPPSGDPLAAYSSAWYEALHRHVTIARLDLKSEAGRRACDAWLDQADVLITSQRPSSLTRLGVGVADLAVRFPRLRTVAIVGDVVAPELPGHDVTYQAEAGLVGDRLPPTLLADMAGAERVVAAVLLALRDVAGAHRVVGLRDVVSDIAEPRRLGLTTPGGPFGGADPAYQVYRAADGTVAVAALEPHFRTRLYNALGLPLNAAIDSTMAARTCAEWSAFAAAHDLPLHAWPSPVTSSAPYGRTETGGRRP